MSWDVFVMRFPEHITTADEIPADWHPEDIGTAGEVRAAIDALVADMAWGSDGWGQGTGDGFSVETSLREPDDTPVNGFTLMFRGGGDAANLAMALAARFDARALGSGVFLEPDSAGEAFDSWQRYRDHALRPRPRQ